MRVDKAKGTAVANLQPRAACLGLPSGAWDQAAYQRLAVDTAVAFECCDRLKQVELLELQGSPAQRPLVRDSGWEEERLNP